jgi:GDP-L-fucose synthase
MKENLNRSSPVPMMQDSRIYIAGHTGLLGSAILRHLERGGYHRLLLRSRSELNLFNQGQTFDFLQTEKPEFVFLCAAKVGGIQYNATHPADFLQENLSIQNHVIEGSRKAGVKRLLFVGSSCIYPKTSRIPITEDQLLEGPPEPTNEAYAIAKIAGIKMCQYYRRQLACDFISAVPTNLFGINDRYDPETSHVLPALIRKVHEVRNDSQPEIEIWGTGQPRREFMLSDDCADALVFLMKHYSRPEPINVGTGEDKSILELVDAVASVIGVKVQVRCDPTKPDGIYRKMLDVSKLREIGWTSGYSLEEGISIAYKDFLKRLDQ